MKDNAAVMLECRQIMHDACVRKNFEAKLKERDDRWAMATLAVCIISTLLGALVAHLIKTGLV
jgi:hypothetical protein